MKPSAILQEAARNMELGHEKYSCIAVRNAIPDCSDSVYSMAFREQPAARAYAVLLGRLPTLSDFHSESVDHRIVALCIAAAIAKSEGK
jgi:hypothetical protein